MFRKGLRRKKTAPLHIQSIVHVTVDQGRSPIRIESDVWKTIMLNARTL